MDKIIIEGGYPLHGSVVTSGSKNAVLPVLAAMILTSGKNKLENVPRVRDVTTMIQLLQDLGAKLDFFKKDKSGIIIGILSQAIGNENQPPTSGMGAYIIAKSAMKEMLRVCSTEYSWLKVKTISPGFTKTKMLDVFDPRYLELAQSEKQFTTPEEVAQLIIKEIML